MLALLLAGCSLHGTWITDNVGTDAQVDLFADNVGSPYVLGQSLGYTVHLSGMSDRHVAEAHVRIADESVVHVSATTTDPDAQELTLTAEAVGVGTTTLEVLDGNDVVVHSLPLEVAIPDAVTIMPRLGEVTETATPFGSDGVIELLQGHTTDIAVHYSAAGRTLGGNNLLGVADGDGMDVAVDEGASDPHDWVKITPPEVGTHTLSLLVADTYAFDVPIHVVDESAAAAVAITDLTPADAGKGDGGMLSAVALDADGGVINNLLPLWSLDGATLGGGGDLLTFEVDPRACHEVSASTPLPDGTTAVDTASVCGRGFQIGRDANVLECSTSPGLAGWAALGLAAAGVVRRRGGGHHEAG